MQTILLRRTLDSHPPVPKGLIAQPAQAPSSSRSSATVAADEDVTPAPASNHAAGDVEKQPAKAPTQQEDPFLVDFSPGDPLNPKNWSLTRRWIYTFMLSHIAILVGAASSINSAAARYGAAALGVSTEVYLLDTALFLVGFGAAATVVGPLSEVGGRNPVYLVTLVLFILFEIGCALSPNMHTRAILRFFAGCAGATPLSNAGGSLADMWTPTQRTYGFPAFAIAGFLGPAFGPVLGGWIGEKYHYEWCDWTSAIWGALVLVTTALFLPETFAPEILKLKAAGIRKHTGDPRFKTALERLREKVSFGAHFVDALKRPFLMLLLEPIVLFFSIYLSVVYIVLFGNLVAYDYIFEPYELSPGMVGTCFLAICVGLLASSAFIPLIYKAHLAEARKAKAEGRPVPPEERLRVAMVGTWLVPISCFWTAWSSYADVSIWSVLVAQGVFAVGIISIFIASYQYTIDAYLSTAASALASLTAFRYPISGGAVLFAGPMYRNLGRHWAMTLLGFLSLAMSAGPFVFWRFGPCMRSWSRYTPKVAV
ncbi:hypothetical protein JCM10449v2_000667 [Rhodotorula kratochvilovae]